MDERLQALARTLAPDPSAPPFGAYIFRPDEPAADLAREVERAVFLDAFGNTADLLESEYGAYDRHSMFICVVDHRRGIPAGAMRVIIPSPLGSKSLNDLEPVWGEPADEMFRRTGLDVDRRRVWDIATIAVRSDYRSGALRGLLTMGLYQTLTLAAFHCGAEWFIAILDMPVFRLIRWKLRMIFAGFAGVGPMPYLGSLASLPAWCDVAAAERRLAAEDDDLHQILVLGRGLEPALRPVDLTAADPFVIGPCHLASEDGVSA
jgi:hypothetical protein